MRRYFWVLRWAFLAAAVLLSSTALGQGAPLDQADDAQKARAREAYVTAKKAYDDGDYRTAYEGFRTSYNEVASPNSHLMMAKALRALGRAAEAYGELKKALPEAEAAAAFNEKYKKTKADAIELIGEMKNLVGYITIKVSPQLSGAVSVNGTVVSDLDEAVIVDPGAHTVRLDAPDGPMEKQITVGAGGTALAEFAPPPPDMPTGRGDDDGGPTNLQTVGFVALGIGGAGMILFGVFGGLTASAFSDLEDKCPDNTCTDPAAQDDIDSGQTFQTVANTFLVVGVVGLIAGGALLLVPTDDEGTAITIGPAGIGIQGTF